MKSTSAVEEQTPSMGVRILAFIGRLLLAISIPLIAFFVLYLGFLFLRDSDAPQWLITIIAIIWGVGGVAVLYWVFNNLVETFPEAWKRRLLPFVFVGPAIAILAWYLAIPTLRTFWLSLFGRTGPPDGMNMLEALSSNAFVGLSNYAAVFTDDLMLQAFRNNILWIIFGSTFSVIFGLLIAVLADRSSFEKAAKSFIFLPMAISFVGASIIWNFIYEYRPAGQPQIGLLKAVVTGLGGLPHAYPQWVDIAPWNNLFLIVIVVWLQAGFSMVLFSAALKGIPDELLEASRIDGATEIQTFFKVGCDSALPSFWRPSHSSCRFHPEPTRYGPQSPPGPRNSPRRRKSRCVAAWKATWETSISRGISRSTACSSGSCWSWGIT